jgi:hypothetical protein
VNIADVNTQPKLSHLTNDELIRQLRTREDLTDIEHELLDRLIRAVASYETDTGQVDKDGWCTPSTYTIGSEQNRG